MIDIDANRAIQKFNLFINMGNEIKKINDGSTSQKIFIDKFGYFEI